MIESSTLEQHMTSGGVKPEFMLPDGTPVFKAGTRLVYVGEDGKAKEWLGAEKTVIGGDTMFNRRAQLREMLIKQYLEETKLPLEEAVRRATAEADAVSDDQLQKMGIGARPATPAAGTPSVTDGVTIPARASRSPAGFPPGVADELKARKEREEIIRMEIADASKAGDRQKVAVYQQELKNLLENKPTRITPGVAVPPDTTPRKDSREEEGKKGYGSEEGKALFKERESLSSAYQANSALSSQLDLMDRLYSDPDLPEGKLGPAIQGVRSVLQSLGVEVGDEVGAADLVNALAQKVVLGIRTADGVNLLPGAISNYEVQLLQSMGPTLGMTAEGRRALISYMKSVAKSQLRLSEEATKFESAEGRLTPGWYKRKERVILEEQARRSKVLRDIASQFGAKQ